MKILKKKKKEEDEDPGNSLAVRWLGLCAFTPVKGGGRVQFLVGELKSHKPTEQPHTHKTMELQLSPEPLMCMYVLPTTPYSQYDCNFGEIKNQGLHNCACSSNSWSLESISGKAMAPHSSTLAWKIPWTEEPVGCSPWGH